MNIVLVGPAYPYRGGIAHYNTLLYQRLRQSHQVQLVNFKRLYPRFLFPGRTQLDESKHPLVVPAQRILDPLNPFSWLAGYRAVARTVPDLVLFQWWNPFFSLAYTPLAWLCRKRRQGRLVFLCHNVVPHETTIIDRWLSLLSFRQGHGFIVHSKTDRTNLKRLVPGARIVKVDHPTYAVFKREAITKTEAKRRLGLSGPVMLFFGYVRAYKGLIYLLEALPRLLQRVKVSLLVVGEFYEDRSRYEQRIRDLGIASHVHLVDAYVPNEEVGHYFSAADVVVLPYVTATQSGVIQIAFAFDKPVITTRVGGLAEVVSDGQTGLLVPARDSEALAEAMIRYFEENMEEPFARRIAEQRERFSWDRLVAVVEGMGTG